MFPVIQILILRVILNSLLSITYSYPHPSIFHFCLWSLCFLDEVVVPKAANLMFLEHTLDHISLLLKKLPCLLIVSKLKCKFFCLLNPFTAGVQLGSPDWIHITLLYPLYNPAKMVYSLQLSFSISVFAQSITPI